jgi:hypothetical protein
MVIAGYVSLCVQLYCILVFTVFHYMFRPIWTSSGVKDSENQNTIKLQADRNIICNNHWTKECSRKLKIAFLLNVYDVCQILEKKWKPNEAVHQLFVDVKKAYDSFRREVYYVRVYSAVSSPECRSKSLHKNSKEIIWICGIVQTFGNCSNESTFDSGGN